MCFATIVILFLGFLARSNAVVRPDTPALKGISVSKSLLRGWWIDGWMQGSTVLYPMMTIFASAILDLAVRDGLAFALEEILN
jgi:hypothetical protein